VSENLFLCLKSGAEIISFKDEVPLKIFEILLKKFQKIIIIFNLNNDEEELKEKKKKIFKVC
jgi:hypothetical protein